MQVSLLSIRIALNSIERFTHQVSDHSNPQSSFFNPMFSSYCGALSCKFICVRWPVMNMTCGSCSSGCNLSRRNLKCNRFPKCEFLCSWQAQMNQTLIWWGILLEWTSWHPFHCPWVSGMIIRLYSPQYSFSIARSLIHHW